MLVSCEFPNDFSSSTFLVDYLFLFVYRNFSCNTAITFFKYLLFVTLCKFNLWISYIGFTLPLCTTNQILQGNCKGRNYILLFFFSRKVNQNSEKFNDLIKPIDQCFLKFLLWIIRYEAGIIIHTYTWFSGQISFGKTAYYLSPQ